MNQIMTPRRSYVDVLEGGAIGDGISDDTAAIQAAINALSAAGGVVYFPVPSASYKITDTLTIGTGTSSSASTKQGVVLVGEGMPGSPPWFGTNYPSRSG